MSSESTQSSQSIHHPIPVLVVLPSSRDRTAISKLGPAANRYEFHWMDDPSYEYLTPSASFDILSYIDRCSAYIEKTKIQAILYSHDLASLVAAVLCEKYGLPGPSVESMFLCTHKYYSRQKEVSPIHFDWIGLNETLFEQKIHSYPVYLKPPCLILTILQFKVQTSDELNNAMNVLRSELPPWNQMFHQFFRAYVDCKKYPLADQDIVLVEELVENASQHCVEGWVEPDGTVQIWALSDYVYSQDGRLAVDHYTTPSQLTPDLQDKIISASVQTVKNHGIKNGFWNVEIWIKDGECRITEVNSRAASVWYHFYEGTYGTSLYQAMLHLACGEIEQVRALAPANQLKQSRRYGAQFHVVTYGNGLAKDFLDYDYAKGIKDIDVTIFPAESTQIRQTRTSGYWLARFELFGEDYPRICKQGNEMRARMLKEAIRNEF